jgi:hypothetical protein
MKAGPDIAMDRCSGRRSRARQHADGADDRPRADRRASWRTRPASCRRPRVRICRSSRTGGLIEQEKQGRHRYYRLADPDVAGVLEGLAGLAARAGHMRVRTGPKDPALRRARICYDHLAGDLGVQMLDSMKKQKLVRPEPSRRSNSPPRANASWRGRCRSTPARWRIRAARCARPASTGASGAIIWRARWVQAIMARFTELNWAARDRHPRQPRDQFHAQRREAICGAVRRRPGLNHRARWAARVAGAHSLRVQVTALNSCKCFDCGVTHLSNHSGAAQCGPQ